MQPQMTTINESIERVFFLKVRGEGESLGAGLSAKRKGETKFQNY